MVPVVGIDRAPTAIAMNASISPGPPILVPGPEQLASGQGLEVPTTVSDHVVLSIVVTNDWSFRTCLWPPTVHHCLMPQCKHPGNRNNTSL